ncbi:sigma-70 family RNA polymerase sigma factor [Methylobacterium planeticum]|uniref:RNA polymerase sigma factor n=1 Tax=Methylobacterium planeticum TaxID=2615211 RepID=A0A6N6MQN1_9HYPH|nr:sigma-70 family RNA polymerase sigma factor [Methylobacterium planeticum]KAB1073704.1 sigma-70 family RNA polymerase sigma factor [Methylobacterium planeticum]
MTRNAAPDIGDRDAGEIDVAVVVRDHLGGQLQAYFGDALTEAVPERLLGLLARFEAILAERGERVSKDFRAGLMSALPALRTFGFSLTGDGTRTDDLVQETLVKAWANQHRFQPGSNMIAWLFTIMRNQFYSEIRKAKREVEDADGAHAARLTARPEQDDVIALKRLYTTLAKVPAAQREALLLVGAEGYTYEEAASRLQCQVGTVKSRVSRARTHLAGLLGFDDAHAAAEGL